MFFPNHFEMPLYWLDSLIFKRLVVSPRMCRYGYSNICLHDCDVLGGGSAPSQGGNYMANGQVYDNKQFVSAHRTLPFGTILNVCRRRKCVSVVVRDRGPFLPTVDVERRIDLSYAAARALDMLHDGRQRVRVSVPTPSLALKSGWRKISYQGLQTLRRDCSNGG